MNNLLTSTPYLSRTLNPVLECVIVACLYISTAYLGQLVAIAPGNVSPVWLPSGIMLALAFLRGPSIAPGIFFGALIGNSWAYFDASSASSALLSMLAGTANGLGDMLAALGAAYLFTRHCGSGNPLKKCKDYSLFILYGGLLGPLCSAILGVGGLYLCGFVSGQALTMTFSTWWMGDAVGVIVLTPMILALAFRGSLLTIKSSSMAFIFFYLLGFMLFFACLHPQVWPAIAPEPLFLIILLMLWSTFRLGQVNTLTANALFCVLLIIITSLGYGPFATSNQLFALLHLQLYIMAFSIAIYSLNAVVASRDALIIELRRESQHDCLSGLYNRAYFQQRLNTLIYDVKRYNECFSLFMFDIDNFKQINDQFGHQAGDAIIKKVATTIQPLLRESDSYARWGGEEFVVLLPNTTPEGALLLAERCRCAIEQLDNSPLPRVSCTFGVTQFSMGDSADDLIRRADMAMYQGKYQGKNKTVVFESLSPSLKEN